MSELRRPDADRRDSRRRLTPWQRMHWAVKSGRIAFYSVMALLLISMGSLAYNDVATAGDPVHMGTFTFTHCVESRATRSCSPRGDWISADRSIRKTDVTLDGVLPPSGQVTTLYKPTSYAADTVHTPDMWRVLPFAPAIGIAAVAVCAAVQTRRWRLRDRGRDGG